MPITICRQTHNNCLEIPNILNARNLFAAASDHVGTVDLMFPGSIALPTFTLTPLLIFAQTADYLAFPVSVAVATYTFALIHLLIFTQIADYLMFTVSIAVATHTFALTRLLILTQIADYLSPLADIFVQIAVSCSHTFAHSPRTSVCS